jgi:lysophospholipase L1-like esterase
VPEGVVSSLRSALIILAIALGGLAVLEGVLRLAGFSREAAPVVLRFGYPDPREIVDLFRPDPRLFWRFRPDSVFDAEAAVVINTAGYRGPLPVESRSDAGVRIAVLGDSVAFGGEEDWPEHLSRRLALALPGREIEVLNFGVPGYTVIQGARQYEDDVRSLQPDLVILSYGWNDHWLARGGQADHQRAFPSQGRARLTLFLTRLRLVQALHALRPAPPPASGDASTGVPRVPREVFKQQLTDLAGQVQRDGAAVLILGLPSGLSTADFPSYLVDMGFTTSADRALMDHTDYRRLAGQAAQAAGAAWIDLQPLFSLPDELPRQDLFSPDGVHPVPAGHAIIAEHIQAAVLAALGEEATP